MNIRRAQTGRPLSDEALADSHKEILGVSARLRHHPRIIALFEFHFMEHDLDRNLRFVSTLYELPSAVRERGAGVVLCFLFRLKQTGSALALVVAKLPRRQTVVSSLSLFSAKQRGYGESPAAIRATPAFVVAPNPD